MILWQQVNILFSIFSFFPFLSCVYVNDRVSRHSVFSSCTFIGRFRTTLQCLEDTSSSMDQSFKVGILTETKSGDTKHLVKS